MVSDRAKTAGKSELLPGVDTETPPGPLRDKRGKEEKKDADK